MGVNFATLLYEPNFDMWAIPITIVPLVSQPGGSSYPARGIFDTRDIDVVGLDGAIFSDQKTILDILEKEFAIIPLQGDHVIIPVDCNGEPKGEYEIIDACTNGGGEHMLTLRKWETASP